MTAEQEPGRPARRRHRRATRRTGTPGAEPTPDATEPTSDPAATGPRAQTGDDTDAGWGERIDDERRRQWLREQRPPHWG